MTLAEIHVKGPVVHGSIGNPSGPVGNGMLLWFEVDDFGAAVARARGLDASVACSTFITIRTRTTASFWIRDPDGDTVVLASPDGDAKET